MSGKTEFGCDFLTLCASMNVADKTDEYTYASFMVARFLLIMWGFSPEEVDSAVSIYANRVENGGFPNIAEALTRIKNHISSNKTLQGQLISHLSAIGYWDYDYTDLEGEFLSDIGKDLEMSKTEMVEHMATGANLAIGLRFFAKNYLKVMSMDQT